MSRREVSRRTLLKTTALGAAAIAAPPLLARPGSAFASPYSTASVPAVYEPNWTSLDQHPLPQWFQDAKFGIFIHWGVFSVPAWGPRHTYAEWYSNYMRNPRHGTYAYHRATYGENFAFRDFIPMWKAEKWDADEWAETFHSAGARYVVPVAEHHDGFPLWDSQYTPWNSVQMGPRRDFVTELGNASRRLGMKYGPSYHAFLSNYSPEYDAPHPLYRSSATRAQYMQLANAKLKELVELCDPDIMWLDGDWNYSTDVYQTLPTLAWYYNRAAALGQEVAANDRFGSVRGQHGDFYTQEYDYDSGQTIHHYWENTRGMGFSFGYNQNEPPEDYLKVPEVVQLLVSSVAGGGNLLLNVGPKGDGSINDIQLNLLRGLGDWLDVNGEAIYGTRVHEKVQSSTTPDGHDVFFTAKPDQGRVYAIVFSELGDTVTLNTADLPVLSPSDRIHLLGEQPQLRRIQQGDQLVISIPPSIPRHNRRNQSAFVLEFKQQGIPE